MNIQVEVDEFSEDSCQVPEVFSMVSPACSKNSCDISWKFLRTSTEIREGFFMELMGKSIWNRRVCIGTNGDQVRNLAGESLGFSWESIRNWKKLWEELLRKLCASTANS